MLWEVGHQTQVPHWAGFEVNCSSADALARVKGKRITWIGYMKAMWKKIIFIIPGSLPATRNYRRRIQRLKEALIDRSDVVLQVPGQLNQKHLAFVGGTWVSREHQRWFWAHTLLVTLEYIFWSDIDYVRCSAAAHQWTTLSTACSAK